MNKILRDFFPLSTQKGCVKLKSNYVGTICGLIMMIGLIGLMSFIFNIFVHFSISRKLAIYYSGLIVYIPLLILPLFAQRIFYTLKGYTKFDCQMIDYLGHFLWVQKLYLKDSRGRICNSVDAHYKIDENNHVVIGLYPYGLTYTGSTQQLEADLASLFYMWDLIDVQVYSDHTDYIFDINKLDQIHDQDQFTDSYRFA